ncbi:MAG: PhoX family protein [Alphaproteobacteria bacterium]
MTGSAPPIGTLIETRLSRRAALGLLGGAGAAALLPGGTLARAGAGSTLSFTEIPHGFDPGHHVAPGYTAQVLHRWGDPVLADAPPFNPQAPTPEAQGAQFGTNCDFTAYFPFDGSSDHGLLCVNHEFAFPRHLFMGFDPETASEAERIEKARAAMESVGVSVIEVRRGPDGAWQVVPGRYARRISATTPMTISGPAAGHERLRTSADPSARNARGTFGNCAGGKTPWGTYLTCEEGLFLYFSGKPDPEDKETKSHEAYVIPARGADPAWAMADSRFDVGKELREPNRFGWVVEIDPRDPRSRPVKRTALGRFQHESASPIVNHDGRIAVYMGDDRPFQFLYRYVSNGAFDPERSGDAGKLLDEGVLSVARFAGDGTLTWRPLIQGEGPLTPENGFHSQADVVIETRRAAALLDATPMDRPEDVEPDPVSQSVFVVLTGNSRRSEERTTPSNPRGPNPHGHILRLDAPKTASGAPDHTAETFTWDIFIRCGNPDDDAHNAAYHPKQSEAGWIANPDNCAFDRKGRLWIATDHGTEIGHANGMWACDTDGPGRALLKHFYRAPAGAEVCGPEFTPDRTTLFLSVQHPGIDDGATIDDPLSRWPDFDDAMPPRPSIVAITKDDGGEIGS